MINHSVFQSLQMALGLILWQAGESPLWLRIAFLIALIATIIIYLLVVGPPPIHIGHALGTNLILIGGAVTAILFVVLLFRLNPFPYIRSGAETMGLGQLVNFDTAFDSGLPDAVSDNIGVVSVERADTDADGFQEWVVFYLFDQRASASPIHGAVYDNDRGNPPVIFPYQLQAPDRNYLSEQQLFGPALTVQALATDRNGLNGADVPELIVQGGNELTIFRFQQNSEPWDFPRDSPARYQPIGFFRGSGGVTINLVQGSAGYGRVTVIDRNGFERSQLAIRSVYGLVNGPDGNQTYLDPIPPLGGVGSPKVVAPLYSTVDFNPTPPNELFNTPFPEKIVLGFYTATCGTQDDTLCNADNMAAGLLWRPPTASLTDFLGGEALSAFNSGSLAYFGLPAFSGNSNLLVSQLRYYPQTETDPDLLEIGGGRDVVTGEQGQVGLVEIAFTVNGSALQEACYYMERVDGRWKIMTRLSQSCTQPPPTPTPTPIPPIPNPTSEIIDRATSEPFIPQAEANGPYTATMCEDILFSSAGSIPVEAIVTYEWIMGDGNTRNEANPIYSYAMPGVYTATLTVRDNAGQQASDTASVIINPPPQSPCGPPPCCG